MINVHHLTESRFRRFMGRLVALGKRSEVIANQADSETRLTPRVWRDVQSTQFTGGSAMLPKLCVGSMGEAGALLHP